MLDRLQKHAFGEIEMTAAQVKSAEVVLRKTIPDLKAIEHSGGVDIRTETDAQILARIKTNAAAAGLDASAIADVTDVQGDA
ncbi:MAG: hypothetical protein KGL42_16870 [Betaproteobacteria bacterium]|nr:hypothetical protein [Betaproteobacteria bacterium]